MENLGFIQLAMRKIDDIMIEKALWNVKSVRKLKPLIGIVGLVSLTLAGVFGYTLYQNSQEPWYPSGTSVARVAFWASFTVFLLYAGVHLICMGLFRNYKDIILEHLAEQYLEQQKKNQREAR